ncbi:VanW family protein [Candidatus Peregrinibacteria bacterium]|nr:VanW family protein [Candidatus Peregrinibacteria bacterium]MBT3598713.1 VanW family protein [Candidatus Peregrinibacteria bacterium]MBT6731277.1 VanW family protein [Candidatus Peregrinibacteria bacterium]MBT7008855.1 VanW family protein [Candidatus Peregrinibacteria bacterium]MBT7344598.1 VanW family protein [Candidatus Peregrinibacteria bacterium]
MLNKRIQILLLSFFVFLCPILVKANYAPITYRYKHHIFTIDPDLFPSWKSAAEVWMFNGKKVLPPAYVRVDGDGDPPIPIGLIKKEEIKLIPNAIRATILEEIAQYLDRDPRTVSIKRSIDDSIEFDSVGLPGRTVLLDEAVNLTIQALREGITDIVLPVEETAPTILVLDKDLIEMGITDLLAVGESDYRGSPNNRQHNISVGLDRFNGYLIPSGQEFSFNDVLGPVNAQTGYRKELVIKGDKTVPDYGGGLCQVSTTAYRGAWEYGFPITSRTNHSYSVRYYSPEGTDATVFPPYKDVSFLNDSDSAVLLQTYSEDGRAYFVLYGTKDDRNTNIFGPFLWGKTSAPSDRVEYTTDIPAGTTRKVGERVPGVQAAWFRIIKKQSEDQVIEPYYSSYEARPRYTQIGIEAEQEAVTDVEAKEIDTTEEAKSSSPVRKWVNRFRRDR